MTQYIQDANGNRFTADQYRAAHRNVHFSGWPSADYLASVGASLVDIDEPRTNADVNAERDKRLHDGASFAVTGIADPIPLQGREFDRTVYLALLTRAQGYKAAGVTDPVLKIRAADDVTHNLTPDQMISLVTQSMNWFEDVMATSWHMKDATGDFPDGIPADYADDTHWP